MIIACDKNKFEPIITLGGSSGIWTADLSHTNPITRVCQVAQATLCHCLGQRFRAHLDVCLMA